MSFYDILLAQQLNGGGGGDAPSGTIQITTNGTHSVARYAKADVQVAPTPPVVVESKDVNFIDYDGTIVASYTAAEFANVDSMPANPIHSGLVSQGWNWTLADAKEFVGIYGKCDIGQMYITASGKTEIDIELQELRKSPYLGVAVNGSATIEWGDGSQAETISGTTLRTPINVNHEYPAGGKYIIKIAVNGEMSLIGTSDHAILHCNATSGLHKNAIYANAVNSVRIGNNVSSLGEYAFSNCYGLHSITLSSTVAAIGTGCFQKAGLQSLTIPTSVTSLPQYFVWNCQSMQSLSLPRQLTSLPSTSGFGSSSLIRIVIPDRVTEIGASAFYTSVLLQSVVVPNGITTIGGTSFYECCSLTTFTIPSSVTSIGASVFSRCSGIKEYHILSSTPPTLTNANAFSDISSDCIIYVPRGSLTAYQSATNWSTYASQMQEE